VFSTHSIIKVIIEHKTQGKSSITGPQPHEALINYLHPVPEPQTEKMLRVMAVPPEMVMPPEMAMPPLLLRLYPN
jgi:hypothetical protein